jgi:HD superfamily phosphodiesterase
MQNKAAISLYSFDPESWISEIRPMYQGADPAHDFSHILRVYKNATIIGQEEGADMQVLLLAALLHDVGSEKKHTSKQGESDGQGKRSVEAFLVSIGLEEVAREKVLYAVDVHRFSGKIVPVTLEARILQDADRLDAGYFSREEHWVESFAILTIPSAGPESLMTRNGIWIISTKSC